MKSRVYLHLCWQGSAIVMLKIAAGRITVQKDIAAAAETVWDCLTDTHRWHEWGPSVAAVVCEQRYIAEAVEGKIKTALGFWVSFQVEEYQHLCSWRWQVAGYRATGHSIEVRGPQACSLSFDMPLWAAPYLLICYWALRRIDRLCR